MKFDIKYNHVDKIVLCLFATIFISIHIILCYLIFLSLNKLKKLEKSEANFKQKLIELDGVLNIRRNIRKET